MKPDDSTPIYPRNLPVDLGAATALRYLLNAALEAETDEPLYLTIRRAQDKLWAEMDRTYPRAKA